MCSGRTAGAVAWEVAVVAMGTVSRSGTVFIFLGRLGVGVLSFYEGIENSVAERDPILGSYVLQLSDLMAELGEGSLKFLKFDGVGAAGDAALLALSERDDQVVDLCRHTTEGHGEIGALAIGGGAQGGLIRHRRGDGWNGVGLGLSPHASSREQREAEGEKNEAAGRAHRLVGGTTRTDFAKKRLIIHGTSV